TPSTIFIRPYPETSPSACSIAASKIDVFDPGICQHVLHGILNEDAALMKYGHNAGDFFDKLHVVFDHDDAGVRAHSLEQPDGAVHFIGAHSGRGLVAQHEFGLLRDHYPDL